MKNRRAATVTGAMHSMFSQELGYPNRVIVDRGSKFTAIDTRVLMEEMGVKLTFIPAGEHQQNFVERAHRTIWSTLLAIRVMKNFNTWKAALH